MIKLNHVIYHYHQMALNFNLNIKSNEHIVILGPSGAGKSTLLNLIAGFIYPEKGEIILNNVVMTDFPPEKRPISMLFQENNLFPHLTVYQNIAIGLNPSLRLCVAQKKQLKQIAEQVNLDAFLTRYPNQLSGGQRQRGALARCLVRQQPILLLDEPFSSLDPALRQEMLKLVKQVCQTHKTTLLMVSHDLNDAKILESRTLLVNNGGCVFDGSISDILSGKTEHAALLGIPVSKK